jgi:hypothetical protein
LPTKNTSIVMFVQSPLSEASSRSWPGVDPSSWRASQPSVESDVRTFVWPTRPRQ